MKLIKTDKDYKYYELSERNQDDACYWDSDVVAISKEDLKYQSAKDCLMDGYVIPCDYESYQNPHCVITDYIVDKDTITFME